MGMVDRRPPAGHRESGVGREIRTHATRAIALHGPAAPQRQKTTAAAAANKQHNDDSTSQLQTARSQSPPPAASLSSSSSTRRLCACRLFVPASMHALTAMPPHAMHMHGRRRSVSLRSTACAWTSVQCRASFSRVLCTLCLSRCLFVGARTHMERHARSNVVECGRRQREDRASLLKKKKRRSSSCASRVFFIY